MAMLNLPCLEDIQESNGQVSAFESGIREGAGSHSVPVVAEAGVMDGIPQERHGGRRALRNTYQEWRLRQGVQRDRTEGFGIKGKRVLRRGSGP